MLVFCAIEHCLTFYLRIRRHFDCFTAWDILTKKKIAQRLPAPCALPTIVEDKVVIAPMPQNEPYPIYVWDLTSNDVQEIGRFSNFRMCHVNAAESVLVAFEINWEKQPPEVEQTKWETTTGQRLGKKDFHLPMPAGRPQHRPYFDRDTWSTYGQKTVAQLFFATDRYAAIHLEYDHSDDRLGLRWIHSAESTDVSVDRSAFLTRHLVYRSTMTRQIAVCNATTGTVALHSCPLRLAADVFMVRTWWKPLQHRTSNPLFRVSGDREVVGLANDAGVELWLFNPNFVPDLNPDGYHSMTVRRKWARS